jgi:hypothetical protein
MTPPRQNKVRIGAMRWKMTRADSEIETAPDGKTMISGVASRRFLFEGSAVRGSSRVIARPRVAGEAKTIGHCSMNIDSAGQFLCKESPWISNFPKFCG